MARSDRGKTGKGAATLGIKFDCVILKTADLEPQEAAEVARQYADHVIRQSYTVLSKGKPMDPKFDADGNLINYIGGASLFFGPIHPKGFRFLWPIYHVPLLAEYLDHRELARRLSAKAGTAYYLWYSSVVSEGVFDVYQNGKLANRITNPKEADYTELDEVLSEHLGIGFTELADWAGDWRFLHSFNELFAPRSRGKMDELALDATGMTEVELVEEYRAGRLSKDAVYYEHVRQIAEYWAIYDNRQFKSEMFRLATGDLITYPGIVLPEPQPIAPDEWFDFQEAQWEKRNRKVAEKAASKKD